MSANRLHAPDAAGPRARRLWDISAPVDASSPVFPGDTPFRQRWAAQIAPGCPVNVSAVTLSPHVGTHADAPLHYDPDGAASGALSLAPYLGPCRVIHAIGCGPLVQWPHIAHAIDANPAPLPPRVLVRTYPRMPVDRWDAALPAFAPDTIARLADRGVQLVGIDSASVDPADSKDLPAHAACFRRGMAIIEGVVLDGVPEGRYDLIALPLRIEGGDASPVRAVLRTPT